MDAPTLSSAAPRADQPLLLSTGPLPHIGFMDGLRGLAALFVVGHHCLLQVYPYGISPRPYCYWLFPFQFGHLGVTLFIVLSGFLLTMPIARKNNRLGQPLPAWSIRFFGRRALRILPTYWAALAYSILFTAFLYDDGNIRRAIGKHSDLIGHLLLLHDWGVGQPFSYNRAMWSIPVEWHIYLMVPLLVLLWRRFHPVAVAGTVILMSYSVNAILKPNIVFNVAVFYYGIFALGGLAAWIVFSDAPWARTARRWRWGICWWLGIMSVIVVLTNTTWQSYLLVGYFWVDLLFSAVAVCGIIYMALTPSWPRRIFGSKLMIWLGSFSFSIYLTHLPMIDLMDHLHRRFAKTPQHSPLLFLYAAGIPAVLLAAYLFYLLFERPFVQLKRRVKARHGENPDVATA